MASAYGRRSAGTATKAEMSGGEKPESSCMIDRTNKLTPKLESGVRSDQESSSQIERQSKVGPKCVTGRWRAGTTNAEYVEEERYRLCTNSWVLTGGGIAWGRGPS